MKRKETIYRGLDLINVFFEDTSLTSPDVFQITEFPSRLTAGKNLIKLKGHPDNLRIGSYLNIEILDFNGDPIYYEVINYIDEDKSRVIAIYVYEETSPGEASITIVGELKQLNGQPVPQEWEGRANVRWSRTLQINPTLSNNSEIIFEQLPNVTIQEQVGVQLNRTYPNSQQFPTYSTGTVRFFSYNNQPAIELTSGLFTKDMEDGTITVSSPSNPLPTPQFTPSSTAYVSTIKKVLSETTLLLDSEFIVKSNQTLSTHTYTSFDGSSYSLTYEATPTYTPTQNSESFAYVTINGLEPATGDIDRVKVFVNGKGTIGTWEQINDIELEEIELFVDTGSAFPDFAIGTFSSQNIIDTYWEAKYFNNGGLGTAPTASWTTGSIGNGVQIIPHGGSDISATNSVMTFQHVSPYAATFVSQSAYKLTIDAIGTRSTVSGNSNPKLSVFISGSAFPYDAQDLLNQNIRIFGRRIGELEVLSNNQRFDDSVFEFEALQNGTGQLIFVIEGGEWQFSDIRTTTDNDPGYTPGYTRIRTEIPTKHKSGNQLSFRLEYYNIDGVKSKQVSLVNNLDWEGGNRYIDGDYSMLTGSLYVADSLESGIAISGYKNTGFVRSLGYSGFETGDPGFLLWSGSALEGFNTKGSVPYSGVGLELYANSDNYFRFSTTDSELDVRTQKFFVGNATTFISSSNGNLQIKSGNTLNIINGVITGSDVYISRFVFNGSSNDEYVILDTNNGIIDAKNNGRQVVSDYTEYDQTGVSTSETIIAQWPITILPNETKIGISFSGKFIPGNGTDTLSHHIRWKLSTAVTSSSTTSELGTAYYDSWNNEILVEQYLTFTTGSTGDESITIGPANGSLYINTISELFQGKRCLITMTIQNGDTSGTPGTTTATYVKGVSIITTREISAAFPNNPAPPPAPTI
jgi:hypothetical protein